jgi:hypothetical protein
MFAHTRKQAGQPMRRRETREHVTLYLKAFNAWATGTTLTQLKKGSPDASVGGFEASLMAHAVVPA